MTTFTVRRTVDAYVHYETNVEAETPEQAAALARKNESEYEWTDEDVCTYDARSFVAIDVDGRELCEPQGDL